VAHDTKFRVVAHLAVGREFEVTNIAVFDFDGFSPRHWLFVRDGEISNDVEADVALRLNQITIGFFDIENSESLDANGSRTRGVTGNCVLELVRITAIVRCFGFPGVLFYGNLVICGGPSDDQPEIGKFGRIEPLALLVFDRCKNFAVWGPPRFER